MTSQRHSSRHSHRVQQAKPFTHHVRIRVRARGGAWMWIEAPDGDSCFTIEDARAMLPGLEQRGLEVELHPELET